MRAGSDRAETTDSPGGIAQKLEELPGRRKKKALNPNLAEERMGNTQSAPVAEARGEKFSRSTLLSSLRDEGKPALAALLENVFRMEHHQDTVTFWLDPSRENLIPLLKSDLHHNALLEKLEGFFEKMCKLWVVLLNYQ